MAGSPVRSSQGRTKRRGHNEGSIYQRASDGRWVGSVNLGWVNGARRRKVVYGATQAEVLAKVRRVQHAAERGQLVLDERTTVGELLERWLADVVPGRVSPATLENYRFVVDKHLVPTLGHKRLTALTPADVAGLLALKQRERLAPAKGATAGERSAAEGGAGPASGGYSPRTVKLIRGVLVQALGQAERWGMVPRNVAALCEGPRLSREEGRTLTLDQARGLLEAAQGERLEAAFVVLLSLGLRRGEALGLRWADVDLDAGVLGVNQALKRVGGKVVLGDVKTARSRRRVNLSGPLVDLLREHRKRQEEERVAAGDAWVETGLVFTTATGSPIDPSNFRRSFDAVCEKAGLVGWHPHELRHSAASLMLAEQVPIEVVSRVLGHSSIRITADVYGHILAPQRQHAAEAMAAALWGEDRGSAQAGARAEGQPSAAQPSAPSEST